MYSLSAWLGSNPASYTFAADDAIITFQIDFLPPFTGSRLSLYSGKKALTLFPELPATTGLDRFVGAAAIVTYSVRNKKGKPLQGAIREKVESLGQSEDVPPRATFHKTVKLVQGVASDLQLFGYDETAIPVAERPAVREASKGTWRKFRQLLFLDGAQTPFALIEWTHRIYGIQMQVLGR